MKDHDNEFNTVHTELLLKGFVDSSTKLHQTREELVQTKEKLDQTEGKLDETKKELVQNREDVEGLIYRICCILQQRKVAKMGFKESLSLLSEMRYRAFLKAEVFFLVQNPNKRFFDFEQINQVQSKMTIFSYDYRRNFKWLLATMKTGEIYKTEDSEIYFKVSIADQSCMNIFISDTNSLEHLKVTEAATLKIGNQHIGLFHKNSQYILRYQIDQIHRGNYNICLCGSTSESNRFWLEQSATSNNEVGWINHLTVDNEVLFRMVKKKSPRPRDEMEIDEIGVDDCN